MAPPVVTMATSSTKVESGKSGSGASLVRESPSRSRVRQYGVVLLERERQVRRP